MMASDGIRAMTATLFDAPEIREIVLNDAEEIIRDCYSDADLLALSSREMSMLSRTTMKALLEGFAMAVYYLGTGRLVVEEKGT